MVVYTHFKRVYYKCMGQKIEYTTQEIDLIFGMIQEPSCIPKIGFVNTVKALIYTHITKQSTIEIAIHHLNLNDEYDNHEPFGEGRYFVIFNENSTNRFEFWTRHLRKFLFEATLKEMPLLINMPFIGDLAKWRLIIAK